MICDKQKNAQRVQHEGVFHLDDPDHDVWGHSDRAWN